MLILPPQRVVPANGEDDVQPPRCAVLGIVLVGQVVQRIVEVDIAIVVTAGKAANVVDAAEAQHPAHAGWRKAKLTAICASGGD